MDSERVIGGITIMQDDARKITYGAMIIAIFATILAITVYIPIVGGITLFFIPLPIILYRLRYDRGLSLLVMITGVLLSLLVGGIILVPFALMFGLLGLVIGDTLRTEKTKLYTFMAAGLTLLISTVLMYAASVIFFGINIIDELIEGLEVSSARLTELTADNSALSEAFSEQMEIAKTFYEVAVPSMFMITSFALAFIILALNLMVAKLLGHEVPNFPPFRDMKIPTVLVWSYLVVLLIGLLGAPEQGSTLYLAYVNASVILRFLFLIQGLSLIHFYMNEKNAPKWVKVIFTVIAFPLAEITILIGVLDSGMNIRAWINRNKSN